MREQKVKQDDIKVRGHSFTVTHIPTATSGSWYVIHDACEIWGAVAIDDLNGEIVGWRNPPDDAQLKVSIERAIKKAFGIPVKCP